MLSCRATLQCQEAEERRKVTVSQSKKLGAGAGAGAGSGSGAGAEETKTPSDDTRSPSSVLRSPTAGRGRLPGSLVSSCDVTKSKSFSLSVSANEERLIHLIDGSTGTSRWMWNRVQTSLLSSFLIHISRCRCCTARYATETFWESGDEALKFVQATVAAVDDQPIVRVHFAAVHIDVTRDHASPVRSVYLTVGPSSQQQSPTDTVVMEQGFAGWVVFQCPDMPFVRGTTLRVVVNGGGRLRVRGCVQVWMPYVHFRCCGTVCVIVCRAGSDCCNAQRRSWALILFELTWKR